MNTLTYSSIGVVLVGILYYYIYNIYNVNNTIYSYTVPIQWSTYRPGLYYGIRSSYEYSPLFGLMYYSTSFYNPLHFYHHFRHWMEERDNIVSYGTTQHNGYNYGYTYINDSNISNVNMSITYINDVNNNKVISRVKSIPSTTDSNNADNSISLLYYIALDDNEQHEQQSIEIVNTDVAQFTVNIHTNDPMLNNTIQLSVYPTHITHPTRKVFVKNKKSKQIAYNNVYYKCINVDNHEQWRAKEHIQPHLIQTYTTIQQQHSQRLQQYYKKSNKIPPNQQQMQIDGIPSLIPTLDNTIERQCNLLVLQYIVEAPFELDIVLYTNDITHQDNNDIMDYDNEQTTKLIQQYSKQFQQQFKKIFNNISDKYQEFAQYLLSSLVSGYSYNYGTSILAQQQTNDNNNDNNNNNEQLITLQSTSLLSTVPCRAFFPRGFLWDEGFHQLIVSQYNLNQSLTILSSWLSHIDYDGYIQRELILGDEARARVPTEFISQRNYIANPPTLVLTIARIAERIKKQQQYDDNNVDNKLILYDNNDIQQYTTFLHNIFPALNQHVKWYFTTQSSHINTQCYTTSVSWRGRSIGHCLASGLDDYPRAEWLVDHDNDCNNINDDIHGCEGHVDLHVWLISLCNSMIALITYGQQYDNIHSNDYTKYLNYYNVQRDILLHNLNTLHWNPVNNTYSDYTYNNNTLYYQNHIGYISIMPFLFGLVEPNSIELQSIIHQLSDSNQLYTSYGIRSLSKSDVYYSTSENYWRGNIWINMNYMIVQALKHYSSNTTVYNTPLSHTAIHYSNNMKSNDKLQQQIDTLYHKLRNNLINNVYNNWHRTGFVYEQYDNNNGIGKRAHPFTGWTSLILNILAEQY